MADAERIVRGRLLSFLRQPAGAGDAGSYRHRADGALLLRDGRIAAIGEAADIVAAHPGVSVDHHPDALVLPGLIDLHIHFPQTQVIASYGTQLLEWLERYTFPAEQRYAERNHAEAGARFFLDELLRNGTTTAAVYGSVHPGAIDAFFAESERRGTLMLAGKTMMDRNAPPALCDTAESAYADSRDLIEKWHGRGRQRYVVTPRFAITSTEAELAAAGALLRAFPDVHLQTHLSENRAEIAAVRGLFPQARDYTDVYDRFGLLGRRSLFGHCIHLSDAEVARLAETGSVAVFCPTSNLFVGSGLFDLPRLRRAGMRIGLGTDVGGGTSYSMLRTAGEAYKVLQLQNMSLSALEAFDLMTRGNAAALGLDNEIGTLETGRAADLVVLDARATPAMAHRMDAAGSLEDELFVLMTLGDDRAVRATYVAGALAHSL
ncbi:MAG TPA: guanine deaminase [Hyphomicrobiales bacterium]|nr:guanine deaminase [Hyphomicrobiales bacterium]